MFVNLRRALNHKGISIKQYAEFLQVSEKTVQNKLQGKTDFAFKDVKKTRLLFPEYNVDYLFAEDEPEAS